MKGILSSGGCIRYCFDDEHPPDRLTRYIGSLLQVRHLVLLFGAGPSYHLGSPSIRNLDSAAICKLVTDASIALDDDHKQALTALTPDNEVDLEDLLTKLQAILGFATAIDTLTIPLGDLSLSVDTVRSLYAILSRSLAHACDLPKSDSNHPASSPWHVHQSFFTRILRTRRGNLPRPKVFTTNYDLVIERSLDGLGIP